MKELIKLIAELENKKVEVSIGNIREVIRCLSDLVANDPELYSVFKHYVQGKQRRVIKARKEARLK
jgi:hypothetical protein